MRSIASIALCLLAVGCATTGQQSQSTMHDPEAVASLEAFTRAGMDELVKGNFLWFKNNACPEGVVWDMEGPGAPVTAKGKAQIDAMIDSYQKMLTSGMQMATTIQSIQCRSSSLSGHCLIDMEQTVTDKGQTVGPMKFRATLIAERHGSSWVWSHWHASLREAFAMPAAPSAAPAPEVAPTAAPTSAPAPAPAPAAAAPAPAPLPATK